MVLFVLLMLASALLVPFVRGQSSGTTKSVTGTPQTLAYWSEGETGVPQVYAEVR